MSDYDPARPVEDPARPSGRPGTRPAHVALAHGQSTLDLLDPTAFTLIGSAEAEAFHRQPPAGARLRPVPRTAVQQGGWARWLASYVGPRGDQAALVRPDGVIAAHL